MKKQNNKQIDIHIYEPVHKISVRIIEGSYDYFYNKVIKFIPDYDRKEIPKSLEGTTVWAGGGSVFIWMKKYDIGTLAHELLHSIFYFSDLRGYKYSNDSEELYCYELQYFLSEYINKRGKND